MLEQSLFAPADSAWDPAPPRPIQRLWLVGSLTDAKERTVRRLLTDSVLLSVDDGARLVGPDDHLLIYDVLSKDATLMGPGHAPLDAASGLADQVVMQFLSAAPLRASITPVLALSFRGGLPAARLAGERTTVTSALHHATNRLSPIGAARACGMALHNLETPDDALVGVFQRERASARDLAAETSLAFCERARDAFERAGLPRPLRSSDHEVRRLWIQLQTVFPFAEPPEAPLARRLGYAADVLLGACIEPMARNSPPNLHGFLPRRVLGRVNLSQVASALPAADYLDDVLTPTVRVLTTPPYIAGQAIEVETRLESRLTVLLDANPPERARGPTCLVSLVTDGAGVSRGPGTTRIGQWWRCAIVPAKAGPLRFTVTFVAPGLDSVANSHTLQVSA